MQLKIIIHFECLIDLFVNIKKDSTNDNGN